MSTMMNEHPWLKENIGSYGNKKLGLEQAWEEAEDLGRFGTHIISFFRERVFDYSLIKPEIVKNLSEISEFFSNCHKTKQHIEMVDPSAQYLESQPRIGTPRFSGKSALQ